MQPRRRCRSRPGTRWSPPLDLIGNASAIHADGRAARKLVEESRERVAGALGVGPTEVIFTSGGTESDNLAVKGMWWSRIAQDPTRRRVL